MTLHAYQQSVFSGSDTVAVAPFAQITVTNASDDSAASIWSDAAGTIQIADGVLLADENGYFIFYADEGTYNIAILSDGISKTLENVEIGAGNPYSGVFKGSWNMSSGTAGPAAPATDYQTTHTATTVTPDSHLTSGQPFPFAAATSGMIPRLTSGIAQASLIVPSTSPGDTVYETMLLLTNSATTPAIFEQLLNGNVTPGIWFVGVSFSSIPGYVQIFVYNDGVSSVGATVSVTAGDVLLLQYDHATGDMTLSVNGTPAGTSTLDVGAIPSGQGLHLMSGVLSNSADVVFAAGSITVNFSDTSDPPGSFVFIDATGGATLSDGGATVTFPSATGHAVNNGIAAFSGKVAIPFRLNSDLPDGAIVNVGLQVSPNYADWVWNGAVALIEYYDPGPNANLVLNDHNVSCARSGEFCLLVDIDARTSSIIIPGGATVLGSTSPAAACGYPIVELASGTYPGGVTLLPTSSYTLPTGYQIITG